MEIELENPEVICLKCGLVNDYNIIIKGDQVTAWCNGCTKFIKNIPYKQPTIYFGKYKDRLISSLISKEEVQYLYWLKEQPFCKKYLVKQIEDYLIKL